MHILSQAKPLFQAREPLARAGPAWRKSRDAAGGSVRPAYPSRLSLPTHGTGAVRKGYSTGRENMTDRVARNMATPMIKTVILIQGVLSLAQIPAKKRTEAKSTVSRM